MAICPQWLIDQEVIEGGASKIRSRPIRSSQWLIDQEVIEGLVSASRFVSPNSQWLIDQEVIEGRLPATRGTDDLHLAMAD